MITKITDENERMFPAGDPLGNWPTEKPQPDALRARIEKALAPFTHTEGTIRAILAAVAGERKPVIHINCETKAEDITGLTSLNVIRVEKNDDGSFTAVTD